jgi:hypothetical protein
MINVLNHINTQCISGEGGGKTGKGRGWRRFRPPRIAVLKPSYEHLKHTLREFVANLMDINTAIL